MATQPFILRAAGTNRCPGPVTVTSGKLRRVRSVARTRGETTASPRNLVHNSRESAAPSSLICESRSTGLPVDSTYSIRVHDEDRVGEVWQGLCDPVACVLRSWRAL